MAIIRFAITSGSTDGTTLFYVRDTKTGEDLGCYASMIDAEDRADELYDQLAHKYGLEQEREADALYEAAMAAVELALGKDPNGDPGDWGDEAAYIADLCDETVEEYDRRLTIEERSKDWILERDAALGIKRELELDDQIPF